MMHQSSRQRRRGRDKGLGCRQEAGKQDEKAGRRDQAVSACGKHSEIRFGVVRTVIAVDARGKSVVGCSWMPLIVHAVSSNHHHGSRIDNDKDRRDEEEHPPSITDVQIQIETHIPLSHLHDVLKRQMNTVTNTA